MWTDRRALFAALAVAGCSRAAPAMTRFEQDGLELGHPPHWVVSNEIPAWAPAFVPGAAPHAPPPDVTRIVIEPPDHGVRLELSIEPRPVLASIPIGRDVARRARWGEAYRLDASVVVDLGEKQWLRTAFHGVPASGIEYATIDRARLYVVTLLGSPDRLVQLDRAIAPTLRLPARPALPLLATSPPQRYPTPVARALASTVLVVTADVVDGQLQPAETGSGVVASADGSVMVTDHVLRDRTGRFHDVLVLATADAPDHLTRTWCAGTPAASKVERELDLALVKCDRDFDGHALTPAKAATRWPTLPPAGDVRKGQRLWILGYPELGGSEPRASICEIVGPTDDFIHTDGEITHGTSGGPVIDEGGRLVGTATEYRVRLDANGTSIETAMWGLVRPLRASRDLFAIAAAGWTPDPAPADADASRDAAPVVPTR